MTRLHEETVVIRMASELGLDRKANPVEEIVKYCMCKIQQWLAEVDQVQTLARLEEIVCERLSLVFEEIWSNDDLERIVGKYVAMGEPVFVQLRESFDEATFATLLERRNIRGDAKDRYVAVIDCRGSKNHRRFFTRWHEIAHLLTIGRQLELPFHRSRVDRNPMERLMDTIAGEVGFYDPIFRPAVEAELALNSALTFEGVERVRRQVCPNASFQATLIACVGRARLPLVYVEAGMGLKKHEQSELNSNQLDLFPMDKPKPELRALVANPNAAAKTIGFRVDKNMRVPEESVLYRLYLMTVADGEFTDIKGDESLNLWKHSDGTTLGDCEVRCEARRFNDRVVALVYPLTSPRRIPTSGNRGTQVESFFANWEA